MLCNPPRLIPIDYCSCRAPTLSDSQSTIAMTSGYIQLQARLQGNARFQSYFRRILLILLQSRMGLFGQTPKQTPKEQVCLICLVFYGHKLYCQKYLPKWCFTMDNIQTHQISIVLLLFFLCCVGIQMPYFSKGRKGKQIFGRLSTQGCEMVAKLNAYIQSESAGLAIKYSMTLLKANCKVASKLELNSVHSNA